MPIDPEYMPTSNFFMIAASGNDVTTGVPLPREMTKEQALLVAAHLVAAADDAKQPVFGRLLERVKGF